MKKKSFVVIGLGTFGTSVATFLASKGAEVLAIDTDEKKIQEISSSVTQAVVADATDGKVLKSLAISDFDVAIVSIGENIETSILVTLLLREHEVKTIIVKVINQLHARIAIKVGADRVIFPDFEVAKKLAEGLISPNIIDEIELSPEYNIAEITVPKVFVGKTLGELNIRAQFGLNVVAIRRKQPYLTDDGDSDFKEETNISPESDDTIEEGDVLVVIGKDENINKFKET